MVERDAKFDDIRPYYEEEIPAAMQRIADSGSFPLLASYVYPHEHIEDIRDQIRSYRTVRDFQLEVMRCVNEQVIARSITEFSYGGIEKLDPAKKYLFVSNHRDIIMDCALLDYALLMAKKPLCEMAFGDNLILNQFVEDLFRMNGGVIVKRELPMKEKYLESRRLSQYFFELITEAHRSIWIAQKSGRSKDGIDETHPSIIKMLFLSHRGTGVDFSEFINNMNIVPISISYEYDPNDINKGREEVIRLHHDGAYEKKKYEDLISMCKGMKCQKGRVHLSVGTPVTGHFDTPDDVARAIDRQIHLNYRLWDTNMFAYDYLEGTDRYKRELEGFDGKAFLSRFAHLTPEVRSFVLNGYANPVRMALKEMS